MNTLRQPFAPNRRVGIAAGLLALVGLTVSCAVPPVSPEEEASLESGAVPVLVSGIIVDNAIVRTYPRVSGSKVAEPSNVCKRLKKAFVIPVDEPIEALKYTDTSDPTYEADGPWVGFELNNAPRPIRHSIVCSSKDNNDTVWISMSENAKGGGLTVTERG